MAHLDVLHERLAVFGTAPEGRLFVGERIDTELSQVRSRWHGSAPVVSTEEVDPSPPARTPWSWGGCGVSVTAELCGHR